MEQHFFSIGKTNTFKSIDFGANIKEKNVYTGETITKRMKGVLVYSLQQQFEKGRIEMSPIEEGYVEDTSQLFEDCLTYQLNNYGILKFDGRDNPVFTHKGDHVLDALMIANLAFIEGIEMSTDFTPELQLVGKSALKPIMSSSLAGDRKNIRSSFMEIEENEDDFDMSKKRLSYTKGDEKDDEPGSLFLRKEVNSLVPERRGGLMSRRRIKRKSIF